MLKTSELLERFNNPQLINQDINNLCQQKLAGIDMEKLAINFGGAKGVWKALKSMAGNENLRKRFMTRAGQDAAGALSGGLVGGVGGGLLNAARGAVFDERDPNTSFASKAMSDFGKGFGVGGALGAVGGAGLTHHAVNSHNNFMDTERRNLMRQVTETAKKELSSAYRNSGGFAEAVNGVKDSIAKQQKQMTEGFMPAFKHMLTGY